MESNISSMHKRLRDISTEISIAQRRRAEEALKAKKALESITAEDAELLVGIVPQLPAVIKYTLEQLEQNANGEMESIRDTVRTLEQYIESRLRFYEEQL